MRRRTATIGVIVATLAIPPVLAEEGVPADQSDVAELVVTGSRAAPRPAGQASAPVAVYTGEDLMARGFNNLNQALEFLSPAVRFAGAVNAGAAANARGLTMRGLGQDEVLILVDGKRWHASSAINFNNTIGRGEVPTDISLIPMSATDHIEVLSDGAAAQYGSDAIAGVVNIVLRKDAAGGQFSARTGLTQQGDGENADLSVIHGFAIGQGGSLTLSADAYGLGKINRAMIDRRYGYVTGNQGGLGSGTGSVAAVAVLPFDGGWEAYGNVNFAKRFALTTVNPQNPVPSILPLPYLPRIGLDLVDVGGTVGLRSTWSDWKIDLSDTIGYDESDYHLDKSINSTFGAASPRSFNAGGVSYTQNIADLTATRLFNILSGANVAAGIEHRYEIYAINRGEFDSYYGAGAQGFPGFNPPQPVDVDRSSFSAFLDTELSILTNLRTGAAVRYEDYGSDGDKVTGKVSLFYQPIDGFAVRGTANTGFRAPSLQQAFFSSVTGQSVAGQLVNVGTFAATAPVSQALGAAKLRPETSRNLSGGVVLTPAEHLTISAEVYHIAIDHRIALSNSFSGPLVVHVLKSAGITNASQVRFFTNAADTRTSGYDLTAAWHHRFTDGEGLKVSLGYDVADTSVTSVAPNVTVPSLPFLTASAIDFLAKAQPANKVDATVEWSCGAYDARLYVTRFGHFRFISVVADQTYKPATTADVTVSARLTDFLTASFGILNLTNTYEEQVHDAALNVGGTLAYPEAGGLGFEGRQYFMQLVARF